MKVRKIILSILLLGIYCSVVFHNIVPHVHSDPEATETYHSSNHSSHKHDHHHSHHVHEESSWVDNLLGILGDLQHTDIGDDHFENFTSQSSHFDLDVTSLNVDAHDFNIVYARSAVFKALEIVQHHVDYPKILYEQHNTGSRPLRGPPSIS